MGPSQPRTEGKGLGQLGLLQVNWALLFPNAFTASQPLTEWRSLLCSPPLPFLDFQSHFMKGTRTGGNTSVSWLLSGRLKHPTVWLSAAPSWPLFTTSMASQHRGWALKPLGPGRCTGGYWAIVSVKGSLCSTAHSCFVECEPVLTACLEFYMKSSNF